MNLDAAERHAQTVSGDRAAARLYADIESELSLGDASEEQDAAGERALSILEGRFPGVRQASHDVVAYGGHVPRLSRAAKHNLDAGDDVVEHEGRRRRASPARPRASSTSSTSPTSARTSSTSARSTRTSSGFGVSDLTGVRSSDVSSAVLSTARWLLAAGVVYQVLAPRGSGAFSTILNTLGRGLTRFVEPVDPLGHASSSQGAQAAPAQGQPGFGLSTVAQQVQSAAAAAGSAAAAKFSQSPARQGQPVTHPLGAPGQTAPVEDHQEAALPPAAN